MKKEILERVSDAFNVTQDDIITKSRRRGCVDARLAYFLSMHVLGIDIHEANKKMPFTHTMPSFYVSKAIELFTLYRDFRLKVMSVIKNYSEYACEQFSRENPLVSSNKKEFDFLFKPEKKFPKKYFKNEKRVLITSYTDEEIARINRACSEAEKFFETYGKGAGRSPMVDRKKYAN